MTQKTYGKLGLKSKNGRFLTYPTLSKFLNSRLLKLLVFEFDENFTELLLKLDFCGIVVPVVFFGEFFGTDDLLAAVVGSPSAVKESDL